MGHVICIANFREQSGKTSTAVNLAASLAVLERKTLLVDCSPDGRASEGLLPDSDDTAFGLFDVLSGIVSARSAVSDTALSYLQILPFGEGESSLDRMLAMNPDREKILSIVMEKFRDEYDFIVFDTPSTTGLLSRSAVIAGDSLIIPVPSGDRAARDVKEVLAFSGRLRQSGENPLKLSGVLFNRCDPEGMSQAHDLGGLEKAVYPVPIPLSQDVDPCRPACLCDMKSPVTEAFFDLCYEFLYRDSL